MQTVNKKVLQDYLFIWMIVAILGAIFHLLQITKAEFNQVSSLHLHQLNLEQ